MAPKAKKSWFDVQTAIMTISMAAVLVLWNLFAGPDREAALRKAAEELANQPEPVVAPPVQQPAQQSAQMQPAQVVIPQPGEKIMLGGAAPQTQIIIQKGGGDGGGGAGGGGGGGGGAAASTSSS